MSALDEIKEVLEEYAGDVCDCEPSESVCGPHAAIEDLGRVWRELAALRTEAADLQDELATLRSKAAWADEQAAAMRSETQWLRLSERERLAKYDAAAKEGAPQ